MTAKPWWDQVTEDYEADVEARVASGNPLKAPLCCHSTCYDETDCQRVEICHVVAEVFGEAVD